MDLASPIMDAVRRAVPDGASILFAWCSSMISADSKKRAAWAANRIMSTAPTEKFGAISTRAPGARVQPRPYLGEALVAEAGRADDHVQAVRDAPAQVVHHRGDVGEVDHDVAAEQRVEGVPLVDPRAQFRVRRAFHGLADRLAHPPPGAKHPNLDHHASLVRSSRRILRLQPLGPSAAQPAPASQLFALDT